MNPYRLMARFAERAVFLARRRTLSTLLAATTLAVVAACGSGSSNDEPKITVQGAVTRPGDYPYSRLQTFPQITQSISFLSGTTPQSHTYGGPTIWSVLSDAQVTVDAAAKNDINNRYVLATASDAYRVAFSLGELNPEFGARPDLIALMETVNGTTTPTSADGFFRITAPNDVKGGRYLSSLIRLDVLRTGSTVRGIGGVVSSSFAVSGSAATRPGTYDLAALQALPVTTQTVAGNVYTGVSLWTFVNTVIGLNTRAAVKNDSLGMVLVATGSDGYQQVVSLGEIDPGFGNQPDLIAYQVNGAGLANNGFARLVIPNDIKAGRWVSNLIALELIAAPAVP